MVPKDLSALSSAELRQFLNSFDTVLCDCDGVLWCVHKVLDGVNQTITKLKQCGKSIHFVSNNNAIGIQNMLKKIKQFHDDFRESDVITPTQAIIAHLKEIKFNRKLYLLGTSYMKTDFEAAGFTCASTDFDESVDFVIAIQELAKDDESIGAVISDYDVYLSMVKLIRSTIFLQRPDVLYITGASDKKIYFNENTILPGPYYFEKSLKDVTNRKPIEFGKPSQNLHKYITEKFNIKNSSRVLFVGDSMPQDIAFGSANEYQTLLVFSGISKFEDMQKNQKKDQIPNYYLKSFGELSDLLKNKLNL